MERKDTEAVIWSAGEKEWGERVRPQDVGILLDQSAPGPGAAHPANDHNSAPTRLKTKHSKNGTHSGQTTKFKLKKPIYYYY